MSTGIGWDSHRLVAGRPLILGGVTIPHDRGLDGHSDADVLSHAVAEALLGALALGVERRTAAEFSFFLAIPTMLGATSFELFKNRHDLGSVGGAGIALGFVIAFVVALVVVRWFVGIVSRRGFGPFAWYRIVAGSAALVWLLAR